MYQELLKKLAEARGKLDQIFADATKDGKTVLTDDQKKQVRDLGEEIKQLTADAKDAKEIDELKRENSDALRELKDTPQYPAPFNGTKVEEDAYTRGAQGSHGAGNLEGFAPAGYTVVERGKANLSVVYEEGDLGLDKKKLDLINGRDYKLSFRNYLRKGAAALTGSEMKVLQEGSDPAGGFLVPADILNQVIQKKPTPTRVAGLVTRIQTSRDRVVMPRVVYNADDIYTTGIRVKWTGEVPVSSTAHRVTDPVFGTVEIPVHTAMLSLPLTRDMVEDSAFPLIQWCSDKFAETNELLQDEMILKGDGLGKPSGITMNPDGDNQPAIVKSGDANLITADGLEDLAFALPEQYDMNARFVFNKTSTAKAISKLKDSDGRRLWGAGLQDSGLVNDIRGRQLFGYPTVLSGFMPNIAANAFPVAFGDFTAYYMINRVTLSVEVLRELYAETNQIVLLGRLRLGGQVAEGYKLKVQKIAA